MKIKKGKKMLMLTDGNRDNASARIRAIQYIPLLESYGYRVFFIPRIPIRPTHRLIKYTLFPFLKRWYSFKMIIAILFGKWDVLFIQRLFVPVYLLRILNRRSIPVIYDFDDAIYIHPKRPQNREKTANMVRHATKVIVSTDYLQEFCLRHGHKAEIIHSPVETNRIYPAIKQKDHPVTIGWIGSPWTSGFLEQIEKPLQKLAEKYQFRFLTVGARPDYLLSGVSHVAKPWVYEDENDELGAMDIGVMPLPDTDWTRMKGGYKLLQYMSAGIPCVASPVGINQSIVKPGENGFLAANEEEWISVLKQLITDPALRCRLGGNGRKDAIELYSREVCFEKLKKILAL